MAYTFPFSYLPVIYPMWRADNKRKARACCVCMFFENGRLMRAGGIAAVERERARAEIPSPFHPRGRLLGKEKSMSNLRDAVGLRLAYGSKNSQFETEFEPASATVWGYFNPRGTACFSLGLLKDIRAHDNALALNGGKVHIESEQHEVRYYVCGSRTPGVFSLGGDLALFTLLIKSGSREELAHYARMCIDNMYARIQNYYTPKLITISMVQGDA